MANDGNGIDPWAFVGHKNGRFAAVGAADMPGVGRFLSQMAKDGLTITTVHSRTEYLKLLDSLKGCEDHSAA